MVSIAGAEYPQVTLKFAYWECSDEFQLRGWSFGVIVSGANTGAWANADVAVRIQRARTARISFINALLLQLHILWLS